MFTLGGGKGCPSILARVVLVVCLALVIEGRHPHTELGFVVFVACTLSDAQNVYGSPFAKLALDGARSDARPAIEGSAAPPTCEDGNATVSVQTPRSISLPCWQRTPKD